MSAEKTPQPDPGSLHLDDEEAARIVALGFDTSAGVQLTDADLALIEMALTDRMGEYFRIRPGATGHRLNVRELSVVVGDLVAAAVRKDRSRARRGGAS